MSIPKIVPIKIPPELIANGTFNLGDIITFQSDQTGHPVLCRDGSGELQKFRVTADGPVSRAEDQPKSHVDQPRPRAVG